MGSSPKVPPPPQPSAQELSLLEKQGKAIDAYLQSLEEQKVENKNMGLLNQVASGLYDPVYQDGKLIDATLNPGRVDQLRADFETQHRIGLLSADRYEKALKGELPVSEGLIQRKAADWTLLKENAARKGIVIEGDSPGTAVSNSTSGNELVTNFNKTYGLLEDAERRGEIASGYQTGLLGGQTLNTAGTSVTAFGPMATGSGYATGAGLLGGAMQPYTAQRQLQYSADVNNAALKSQNRAGWFQLGSGLLGLGAGYLAGA